MSPGICSRYAADRQVQNGPPNTTRSTSRALVTTDTARATSTAEPRMISLAWSLPASATAHNSANRSWTAGALLSWSEPFNIPAASACATRTCGMAEDFTQPCCPQSQRAPPGSTTMCPISPALPEVPRTTSSLSTIPQPIPVPIYMKTKLPSPLGPPAQVSATAALVTSLSMSV